MFTFASLQSSPVPILLTPAISPNSETNPGFRVYILSEEEKDQEKELFLLDYLEYFADLLDPAVIKSGKLQWKLEYDFDVAYSESRVDSAALIDLLRKLKYVRHPRPKNNVLQGRPRIVCLVESEVRWVF
jgi:hypothetical protein